MLLQREPPRGLNGLIGTPRLVPLCCSFLRRAAPAPARLRPRRRARLGSGARVPALFAALALLARAVLLACAVAARLRSPPVLCLGGGFSSPVGLVVMGRCARLVPPPRQTPARFSFSLFCTNIRCDLYSCCRMSQTRPCCAAADRYSRRGRCAAAAGLCVGSGVVSAALAPGWLGRSFGGAVRPSVALVWCGAPLSPRLVPACGRHSSVPPPPMSGACARSSGCGLRAPRLAGASACLRLVRW